MARKFNGSADAFQTSSTVNLTGVTKLTVSWWMYIDNFGANNDELAWESSANFNSNAGAIIVDASPSSPTGIISFGPSNGDGANYNTIQVTQPSQAAWHHYMGTIDLGKWGTAVPNCAVQGFWIDGISQTLTALHLQATGPADFGNYTWNFMCRGGASLFCAGRMRRFAIWRDILMSGGYAASFYNGQASPGEVARDHLVGFWEMGEAEGANNSTDFGVRGKNNLTAVGSPTVCAPPPRLSQPFDPVARYRRVGKAGGVVAVQPMLPLLGCGA